MLQEKKSGKKPPLYPRRREKAPNASTLYTSRWKNKYGREKEKGKP
jgi:hypothetical protein